MLSFISLLLLLPCAAFALLFVALLVVPIFFNVFDLLISGYGAQPHVDRHFNTSLATLRVLNVSTS